MRAGSSGMISRATTVWPAIVRWSISDWPPVSVSSVRVSLTVMTAQRATGGPWAVCSAGMVIGLCFNAKSER